MRWHWVLCLTACLVAVAPRPARSAAGADVVRHPNLLLNADEIERVKAKVSREPWAAKLLDRLKALADDDGHTGREPRDAAVAYALTGEPRYAAAVRRSLLNFARSELPKYERVDVKLEPELGAYGPCAQWAWAYDLTYDTFDDDGRRTVERLLRAAAGEIVEGCKVRPTTQGLVFEKHWKVALIGYCLGDRGLIEWGMHDPGAFGPGLGGVYTVLDANVRDRLFWSESPQYGMGTVLHGFLAAAEAARHYDGTDLYGYVSPKSGGSIRGLFDGYLRIAYPREATGINGGSLRLVTYGDGSTGYTPTGQQTDTWLMNPVAGGPKRPPSLNGEFEVAYARYKDPGYAWVAGLNPARDAYVGNNRSVWGFAALTHGEPLPPTLAPPPAPGGVYPTQGLAVLHGDESPAYWTGGSVVAALRLGAAVGHGHNDYFHLLLHGKGRLLYPTVQIIQYEPNYLGWTREGVACNTLLVDGQSPRPGPVQTRQDFSAEAKFAAATGSVFDGVTQTRALVVTPEYAADVFRAADDRGRRRTFDFVQHGLGRLFPGNPAAYRPTHELVPFYWWVEHERGRTTGATWQAEWVQHSAGVRPGGQAFGDEWFAGTAGVRMTMLGRPETQVYCGDGPITDAPPYALLDGDAEGSVPVVVTRRQGAAATTFAAVHEPFDRKPAAVRRVRRVDETDAAVGMAVEADAYSDRVLVGFDPAAEQTLRGDDGESFTFKDHGYVRVAGPAVVVRGSVSALRVRVKESGAAGAVTLVVNGRPEPVTVADGFASFGRAPEPATAPTTRAAGEEPSPVEQAAAVHYSFLPDEVHLRAGGERAATVHLRCAGRTAAGGMAGRLRFVPPAGVAADPAAIDVSGMVDGDERDVPVRFRADPGTAAGLYPVAIEPADGAAAAAGELTVSVGVVMTTDRRLPLLAQSLVRAPGYTIRVDHRSGVSYYLLDADGRRRHGHLGDAGTGFFAVARPDFGTEFADDAHGRWAFHYRLPIRFVFEGKHDGTESLTMVAGGARPQVRLRYTFHEDRIVATLVDPTDPTADYEVYLGEFDVLGDPRFGATTGTERKGKETAVVTGSVFFPHPLNRQGLLVTLPEPRAVCARGTGLHVSVRVGQDVTVRFAGPDELPDDVRNAPAEPPRPGPKGKPGKPPAPAADGTKVPK